MKTLTQIGVDKLTSLFTRVSATKGCRFTDGTYAGPKYGSIVVNADAKISAATTSTGASLMTLWGIEATDVLKAGTLLTTDIEDPGSTLTVAEGSVIVYFD